MADRLRRGAGDPGHAGGHDSAERGQRGRSPKATPSRVSRRSCSVSATGPSSGCPFPFLILIVVCLLLAVLLNRTVFGVSLYLLGSNPVAAKYSNVNVRSVLMREYILSAFSPPLTAFIMMGQLNSVKANYAESYLLVAVLACFLGGVDPFGGAESSPAWSSPSWSCSSSPRV